MAQTAHPHTSCADSAPTTDVANDPAAHDALRAAHASGYRFPEGFHGFTGAIAVQENRPNGAMEAVYGTFAVGGPGAVTVEELMSDTLAQWATGELRSVAGHRWSTPYEQADGKHTLTFHPASDSPLGAFIKIHDDRFDSAYRVDEGRITQVMRSMGPMRFTITIQRHRTAADGRTLPELFTVAYWREGRLVRSDMYEDTYTEHEGVSVPQRRRVVTADDDGFTVREMTISEVSMLEEPMAQPDSASERHGTRAG